MYPITVEDFNYAPVAVGIVVFICFGVWWMPCIGACHWFKGPPHVPDLHVQFDGDDIEGLPAKPSLPPGKPTRGDDSAHYGMVNAPIKG